MRLQYGVTTELVTTDLVTTELVTTDLVTTELVTTDLVTTHLSVYFCTNLAQFNTDITKINFTMTYLTRVAQNWFEVGLNQEDQGIFQDWLFD